jgi:hypothetical protein
MADSAAFDWICSRLEQETSLDRLESRGTVRLALKGAGLDARGVTPEQLKVVIEKVLAGELTTRGIESAPQLCTRLASEIAREAGRLRTDTGETPDAVFSRLGGS